MSVRRFICAALFDHREASTAAPPQQRMMGVRSGKGKAGQGLQGGGFSVRCVASRLQSSVGVSKLLDVSGDAIYRVGHVTCGKLVHLRK